jgi:xylan 1,4-beta-xylosidase
LITVPSASRAQVSVTGEVHWDQSQNRSVPGDAYGLNVWQGFDPNQAGTPGNQTYKDRMATMKPSLIRYHSWEMLQASTTTRGWVTGLGTSTLGWDKNNISTALTGAYSFGPKVMMNIPGYPDQWKLSGGKLNPAYYQAFADWCALLVRYVNVDLGKNVKHWEILNEPDLNGYSGRTDFQEVGRIYEKCAAAMKAVDSTITCGGPAFASAYDGQRDNMRGFFDTCGPNLGFITYHGYGSGSASTPTQTLYNNGANLWGPSYWITTIARGEYGRNVPRYHDEVNVNSSQTQGNLDSRTWNEKGMIFNALALLQMGTYGYTEGTALWNESDGWNGIMDGPTGYTRRRRPTWSSSSTGTPSAP